jgi:hypothetical protein
MVCISLGTTAFSRLNLFRFANSLRARQWLTMRSGALEQNARVETLRATLCANLFSDAELAAALGVSLRTVYRFAERGLPIVKIGPRRWVDPTAASAWLVANSARTAARVIPRPHSGIGCTGPPG